jgi:mRNA-degrading endonuclease RelE of RelBE toxin-antitoxin system
MGEEKPNAVYDIDFLPAASRRFRKLTGDIQKRIEQALLSLRTNPRPPVVKKLRA